MEDGYPAYLWANPKKPHYLVMCETQCVVRLMETRIYRDPETPLDQRGDPVFGPLAYFVVQDVLTGVNAEVQYDDLAETEFTPLEVLAIAACEYG